jgi:hypothetical protein
MPNKTLNEQLSNHLYKTGTVTSFASFSLKTIHIASKQVLELTIQNSFPTYTRITS